MTEAVDIRCPRCKRYICSVRAGEPVRAYCLGCGLKFEQTAKVDRPVQNARTFA